MKRKRLGPILAGGLVLVIVVALIDGGEEPLHPIEQTIDLPENVR